MTPPTPPRSSLPPPSLPGLCLGAPVGVPGYTPGPGYQRHVCRACGRPCWLGPAQTAIVFGGEAIPICIYCAIEAGLMTSGGADWREVRELRPGEDTGIRFEADKLRGLKKRTCRTCAHIFLGEQGADVCPSCKEVSP